jgi:hypothetical protein
MSLIGVTKPSIGRCSITIFDRLNNGGCIDTGEG